MTICVLIGRHKHMCRKITTFTFGDIASVSIARFECTKDRILNILNLFEYKNAVIEIGCIEKTSALFQIIKTLSIKYSMPPRQNPLYTDIVFEISGRYIAKLLCCILESECESFCVNIANDSSAFEQLSCEHFDKQRWIKRGTISLSIAAIINENQIDITFNKNTYNAKQIVRQLKKVLAIACKNKI